jgi:hypothetical protein
LKADHSPLKKKTEKSYKNGLASIGGRICYIEIRDYCLNNEIQGYQVTENISLGLFYGVKVILIK